eukprot:7391725-Prymnesium_polylepis.1
MSGACPAQLRGARIPACGQANVPRRRRARGALSVWPDAGSPTAGTLRRRCRRPRRRRARELACAAKGGAHANAEHRRCRRRCGRGGGG